MKKLLYVLLISLAVGSYASANPAKNRFLDTLTKELGSLNNEEENVVEEKTTFDKVKALPGAFVEIVKAHPRFALGALGFVAAGFVYDYALNKYGKWDGQELLFGEAKTETLDLSDELKTEDDVKKLERYKGVKDIKVKKLTEKKDDKDILSGFEVTFCPKRMIDFKESVDFKKDLSDKESKKLMDKIRSDFEEKGIVNVILGEPSDGKIEVAGRKQESEKQTGDRFWAKKWMRDFAPSGLYNNKPKYYVDGYVKPGPSKAWKFAYTDRGKVGLAVEGGVLVVAALAAVYLYKYAKEHNPELIDDIADLLNGSSDEEVEAAAAEVIA